MTADSRRHDELRSDRLREAIRLKMMGLPVESIAAAVGYRPGSLNVLFHRHGVGRRDNRVADRIPNHLIDIHKSVGYSWSTVVPLEQIRHVQILLKIKKLV